MPKSSASASAVNAAAHRDRLPVNPRRTKVAPEQRKRVSTACNSCNVRRIKCSGDKPCRQCSTSSRECEYPALVEKVTIPRAELDELRERCAALEISLREAVQDSAVQHGPHVGSPKSLPVESRSNSMAESSTDVDDDTEGTQGRLLHDTDGTARYLGETSGATFLDNLKAFMVTIFPLAFNQNHPVPQGVGATFLASVGRYQSFDSRPLFLPPVDPMWLPSSTEMTAMLAQLRYFIQDGDGVFPSGGIYFWGDMSTVPPDPNTPGTPPLLESHRSLAFFHAAFAFAGQLTLTTPNSKLDGQLGETYIARARALLGNPLDLTMHTIGDVAVLALMGLFLVENNRRDAAYIHISNAMHISIMHGVHRGWSVDETGKRTFWTVYILDQWLSCLMGRPPTILDDAVRLDMPQEYPGLPSPIGLRAHIELSKISGYIVSHSSCVAQARNPADNATSYVDRALQLLSNWRNSLPAILQMPDDAFGNDRACCALHMAQGQLIILTIRPIFLMAVKRAVADRFVNQQWNIEQHTRVALIRQCVDAARRNLRLGRWVRDISPEQKLLMPDLHHIFNAAIVLMLHQIVFADVHPGDGPDIGFAIEVYQREAATGSNYGKDCTRVLQDLSALSQRLRRLMFGDLVTGLAESVVEPVKAERVSAPGPGPGPGPGVIPPDQFYVPASLPENNVSSAFPFPYVSDSNFDPQNGLQMAGQGEALYQELVTWMDNDNMGLYNNYLL